MNAFAALAHRTSRMQVAGNLKVIGPQFLWFMPEVDTTKHHFIGYAPARNPRLLVAVMVDEPKGAIYGGVVAAPAFEQIMAFALPYLRIPPG